jgi:hypothetical protein
MCRTNPQKGPKGGDDAEPLRKSASEIELGGKE